MLHVMSLCSVKKCMHRPVIEPGSRGWQPRILPLDHRCLGHLPLLSCRLWSLGSSNDRSVLLSESELLRKLFKASYRQKFFFCVLDVAFLGCFRTAFLGCCRTATSRPIVIVWGSFGLPCFFLRFHFLLGRVRRPQGKRSYQKANQGGASIRFMATTMCT